MMYSFAPALTARAMWPTSVSVAPVNATGAGRQRRVDIDRIGLARVLAEFHHLADGIDQQPVRFTLELDADSHRRPVVGAWRQAKPAAHVDHRDDAAAQVED